MVNRKYKDLKLDFTPMACIAWVLVAFFFQISILQRNSYQKIVLPSVPEIDEYIIGCFKPSKFRGFELIGQNKVAHIRYQSSWDGYEIDTLSLSDDEGFRNLLEKDFQQLEEQWGSKDSLVCLTEIRDAATLQEIVDFKQKIDELGVKNHSFVNNSMFHNALQQPTTLSK